MELYNEINILDTYLLHYKYRSNILHYSLNDSDNSLVILEYTIMQEDFGYYLLKNVGLPVILTLSLIIFY